MLQAQPQVGRPGTPGSSGVSFQGVPAGKASLSYPVKIKPRMGLPPFCFSFMVSLLSGAFSCFCNEKLNY